MTRVERFKELCDEWLGEVPSEDGPYNCSADEDAAEYLYPDERGDVTPLQRFCLVTSGGEYVYLYPVVTALDDTAEVLGSKCGDTTFGEGPVCLVDLDDGTTYWPQWQTLLWNVKSWAPTARPQ